MCDRVGFIRNGFIRGKVKEKKKPRVLISVSVERLAKKKAFSNVSLLAIVDGGELLKCVVEY